MSVTLTGPGLYRIDIASQTYYGETSNIDRRKRTHWKELLTKRHHNILLRRLVCEYGLDAVSFTVISHGPQWKSATARRAEETRLMTSDENSLNTKGRLEIYATHLRLPAKPKYLNRELYLRFERGIVWVMNERHGTLIGLERTKGKIATGYYIADENGYINASPNIRRPGPKRGAGEVRADAGRAG